jgi:polyisoprenoid-binding protein YceI
MNTIVMNITFKLAVLTLVSSVLAQNVSAAVLTSAVEKGKTTFVAVGKPAMLRIKGESKGPEGQLNLEQGKVSGSLSLDLNGLNTGIELRDEHMKKKYLEVEKFAKAELKFNSLTVPELKAGATVKDMPFEGTLNMHGETKPVKGTAQVNVKDGEYEISAVFTLNLSEFKVDIPSYMGIKVADTVNVEVAAILKEKK